MKIYKFVLGLLLGSLIIACHGHKKGHTHNEKSHEHIHNDYYADYELKDAQFGTKTVVTIMNGKRIMITNALPNHETGEFPRKGNPNRISAQKKTYTFPLNPIYTGKPNFVREPGVALNGVKFEPGTAEVVVCDTGENYRIEAFQDLVNLGLDFNNAHVQPTGAYHYHGTPTSVIEKFDTGTDLVHVGFAHDGFPIYYSKSGKYKSSYQLKDGSREGENCIYTNPKNTIDVSVGGHHDGTYGSDFEFKEGLGDLDPCNGITIDGKYMYLVTKEFPYVSRCLMGTYDEPRRHGPPNGARRNGPRRGRPNFATLLSHMDKNKDGKISKSEVRGPLAEHFSHIDKNEDGYLTKDEFE